MNGLDLLVVVAAALAAVGGWRLGLITRALGWVGAVLGLAIGVSVVPAISRWIDPGTDAGVLLLGAGCFILLASAGQAVGVAIGSRLRPHPEDEIVRAMDAAGGSLLGVAGVVVILWLLVPLMASTQGWVAQSTRSSAIAQVVTDHLPDPPEQVAELERSLAAGQFPTILAGLQPAPELPPPPEGSPVDAATLEQAASSTARLQSRACDLVQSGSGYSVGDGLWATNAHVVAGAEGIELTTPDGASGRGRVVAFDPSVDLALVRSDLRRPAFTLVSPTEDVGGLVLGFPGGGPFEPSPFLIGDELTATGYDIYDEALVRRDLLVMASQLEPGDSGSALLDAAGRVVGTAVAIAPDRPGVAYALRAEAVQELVAAAGSAPVDTGRCLG
jgi:S1-C subfamily serine protease